MKTMTGWRSGATASPTSWRGRRRASTPCARRNIVVGRTRLRRKVLRHRPAIVAAIGITVFRALYPDRKGPVALGAQPERIGESVLFVLPNPSGRNANYSYAEMLAAFRLLKRAARLPARSSSRR